MKYPDSLFPTSLRATPAPLLSMVPHGLSEAKMLKPRRSPSSIAWGCRHRLDLSYLSWERESPYCKSFDTAMGQRIGLLGSHNPLGSLFPREL